MEWYPGVVGVRDNGFGGSRNGQSINGVVIHHVAGTNGLNYVANKNTRNSHPTYHIARDGSVTGIVHPDRRPFSTAGQPDPSAVTFEIDNSSTGGDWPISAKALDSLINVIVFHASQSPRAGKGFAKNKPSVKQSEFFIAWHSQYKATACPGPFIMSQLDYIVEECTKRAAPPPLPPAPPAPKPAAKKPAKRKPAAKKTAAKKPAPKPVPKPIQTRKPSRKAQELLRRAFKRNPAPKPSPKMPANPQLAAWLKKLFMIK
jgi:hypothetical protein